MLVANLFNGRTGLRTIMDMFEQVLIYRCGMRGMNMRNDMDKLVGIDKIPGRINNGRQKVRWKYWHGLRLLSFFSNYSIPTYVDK